MMGCLTFIILLINIAIAIFIDIVFWNIGSSLGIAGIFAILGFIIAYSISEEAALSPRDFFWNSEWGIFCKKLAWAWSTALVVFAVAYIISAYLGNDVLGIF